LILDHLVDQEQQHAATVKAEADRKQKVKEEIERKIADKEEERRRRREAREAKRKAEELEALRKQIEETFVAQGESRPDIGAQELSEIDGNLESKAIVGGIGGILGQMIVTLSIMEKNFNR
jgi:hypothetical protein